LPVAFLAGLLLFRSLVADAPYSWLIEPLSFLAILIAIFLFSNWVFTVVEEREQEIRDRSRQLQALYEAGVTLTTELDVAVVLQTVVDLAAKLVDARYGALGVLDDDGKLIDQFITFGIDEEQRSLMGAPPRGHGVLGIIIKEGRSIRVDNIQSESGAVGFPPNHPPMKSFIGVPVRSKGQVIGDLYLTDKNGENSTFNQEDQQLLEMFANQAAVAIENAQLYRQIGQLAVLKERERIGMDLHDGIIQSIYAIGLMLEDSQHRIKREPDVAFGGITNAIHGLNDVIRDIRNYILDLRPQRFQGRNLITGLEELVRDLHANTLLEVELDLRELKIARLAPEKTVEILHVVQEAFTNIRKHARAGQVWVNAEMKDGSICLRIDDDGVGIPVDMLNNGDGNGNGLRNMRERTSSIGGTIEFLPRAEKGTRIELLVKS
jgi:signal transduction histidine kinase